MNLSQRARAPEIIDLGPSAYGQEEFSDCLEKLVRIGKHIGAEAATLRAFRQLPRSPDSILDVGCGGGHFTAKLAKTFPDCRVIGVDRNEAAIAFAKQRHLAGISNLAFHHVEGEEVNGADGSVDVITATLVCHHMDDAELVDFLVRARRTARQAIILNDLHRHRLALVGFFVLSHLLYRNRLIQSDGLVSIRKSFRRRDWQTLLRQAGIPGDQADLRWCWPFRWRLSIRADCG